MPTNAVAGQPGEDPTLPDVKIILGGKQRQLCFDFAAIARVESETGINLLAAPVSFPSFSTMAAMLWASLLRGEPELTLAQVGKLITTHNAPILQAAILKAWFDSTPEPDPEAAPGKTRARKTRRG